MMENKRNGDKIKIAMFIIGIPLILCGVFFTGRCTGKSQFRGTIATLKTELTDSLEREQQLEVSIERERRLVSEMVDNFKSIGDSVRTVQDIWENISVRIDELDEALTAQREIADILADLDRRTGNSASSVEARLNEGVYYLDQAIERVQSGHD